MDVYKIAIKLFLADAGKLNPHQFVPVFHRWIQTHALADHLLIDVADYSHVHQGPGTVLVTAQANLHLEDEDGQLGLLYFRKQPVEGASTFRDRLRAVLQATFTAAALLEREPGFEGALRFATDRLTIRLMDRLLAPNTRETYDAVTGDVEAVVREFYAPGTQITLEHAVKDGELAEVRVKVGASPSLEQLRLSSTALTPSA